MVTLFAGITNNRALMDGSVPSVLLSDGVRLLDNFQPPAAYFVQCPTCLYP